MTWAGVAIGGGTAIAGIAGGLGAANAGGGGMNFAPAFPQGNAFLKYLFGGGKGLQKKIAKGQDVGLFGPEARDAIGQYMQGTTFGPGGPNLLSTLLGSPSEYMSGLEGTLGYFDDALNTMSLFNETGLPTDGTAYFNEAIRKLGTDIIPQLAEVSGLGVQSGGFANNVTRESANLLGQASLANIDLAEAAANRRQQASTALAGLATAKQAIPLNTATQLSSLFGEEQGRTLDVFSRLMGLGNQQQYGAPSYNPYDPTSGYLSGGLGGLSGILSSLSNFNFNTGPTTPTFETDFSGLYDVENDFNPVFTPPNY